MGFKNVLHIDDDEDDLDFFSSTVAELNLGIKCTSLSCAKQALEKLISHQLLPDVIFLDLNMPMMDGFQFLKEIRNHSMNTIPIVVLSTSSQKETEDAVKKSGGFGYLVKPSSTKELIRLIKPFFL